MLIRQRTCESPAAAAEAAKAADSLPGIAALQHIMSLYKSQVAVAGLAFNSSQALIETLCTQGVHCRASETGRFPTCQGYCVVYDS